MKEAVKRILSLVLVVCMVSPQSERNTSAPSPRPRGRWQGRIWLTIQLRLRRTSQKCNTTGSPCRCLTSGIHPPVGTGFILIEVAKWGFAGSSHEIFGGVCITDRDLVSSISIQLQRDRFGIPCFGDGFSSIGILN